MAAEPNEDPVEPTPGKVPDQDANSCRICHFSQNGEDLVGIKMMQEQVANYQVELTVGRGIFGINQSRFNLGDPVPKSAGKELDGPGVVIGKGPGEGKAGLARPIHPVARHVPVAARQFQNAQRRVALFLKKGELFPKVDRGPADEIQSGQSNQGQVVFLNGQGGVIHPFVDSVAFHQAQSIPLFMNPLPVSRGCLSLVN